MALEKIASWDADLALLIKNFIFDAGLFLVLLAALFFRLNFKNLKASQFRLLVITILFGLCCSRFPARWMHAYLHAKTETLLKDAQANGCLDKSSIVVMLGGGIATEELPNIGSQIRLIETAKLMHRKALEKKPLTVVLSGGTTFMKSVVREAVVYESYLKTIAPEFAFHKIVIEDHSQNTYQNAAYTREILRQKNLPMNVIVVTSDYHMPRSIAVFKKLGMEACPLPSPSIEQNTKDLISFANGLVTRQYINELVGMLGYRWKDWI